MWMTISTLSSRTVMLIFMTLRPYEGFIQWCDANDIDYFVLQDGG